MNTALVNYYRCPDDFAEVTLKGQLSGDCGYFRFGQDVICYGQSTSGFRATQPLGDLYDIFEDVTIDGSSVLLPFDPDDVINNLRLERYANRHHYSTLDRWGRSLRNTLLSPATVAYQRAKACSAGSLKRLAEPRFPTLASRHDC